MKRVLAICLSALLILGTIPVSMVLADDSGKIVALRAVGRRYRHAVLRAVMIHVAVLRGVVIDRHGRSRRSRRGARSPRALRRGSPPHRDPRPAEE